MHIDQAVEYLCDWNASVTFSRKSGERFVEVSATVNEYEFRANGSHVGPAVEQLIKSVENAEKMKYTRPITKGKRSKK